jgi:hypothetical protein
MITKAAVISSFVAALFLFTPLVKPEKSPYLSEIK